MIDVYNKGGRIRRLGSVDLNKYFRLQVRKSRDTYIADFTVINTNLIMVVTWLGVVFVSLPSGKILTSFEFGNGQRTSCASILRDGRVYSAGDGGLLATFQFPENVRDDLRR